MSLDKFKIESKAKDIIIPFDEKAEILITETDGGIRVDIETENSGLLIGRGGETLDAFQHLLRLILARELEEFFPLELDIAGYKAARQKELEEEALRFAKEVLDTGISKKMSPMNAYERRLIHLVLSNFDGVETESEGEGPKKRIVIKKKK